MRTSAVEADPMAFGLSPYTRRLRSSGAMSEADQRTSSPTAGGKQQPAGWRDVVARQLQACSRPAIIERGFKLLAGSRCSRWTAPRRSDRLPRTLQALGLSAAGQKRGAFEVYEYISIPVCQAGLLGARRSGDKLEAGGRKMVTRRPGAGCSTRHAGEVVPGLMQLQPGRAARHRPTSGL